MKKMGKGPARLKTNDFERPKRILDDDFLELCETYQIPSARRLDLRRHLDDLVETFRDWIEKDKLQPNRSADLDRLKAAKHHVKMAAERIDRLGRSGRAALKAISPDLSPMLAARWILEKLPDNPYAPESTPISQNRDSLREPKRTALRSESYFVEEDTLQSRAQSVRHRPAETIHAVLKEIEKALDATLRTFALQPDARGGRTPLKYRHWLIVNLIEISTIHGIKPSTGPRSKFAALCETVAELIGWPTEGMISAIPKAIRTWRNLPGKI